MKINLTIKALMLSDFFALTGFGLIAPIMAVFIKEDLTGGSIFAAGLASSIFMVVKSVVQLPFSRHVDRHDDHDDIKWLIIGMVVVTAVPLMYIYAGSVNHIYIIQAIYGVGAGLAYPTWLGLWSTHLDKNHESFEWSLYSTVASFGSAVAAAAGGAMAEFWSFNITFIFAAALCFVGFMFLIYLKLKMRRQAAPARSK